MSRGISNIVIEALLIIAGITLAVIFSSTAMSKLSEFQSRFSVISSEVIQSASERLAYVYATYSPADGCFIIYVKNVGSYPVYSLERGSLIFGSVGSGTYVHHSGSATYGCGCWNYVEYGVVNGVLDPSETMAIKVYNATAVIPPYYFKFVTSKGTSISAEFDIVGG